MGSEDGDDESLTVGEASRVHDSVRCLDVRRKPVHPSSASSRDPVFSAVAAVESGLFVPHYHISCRYCRARLLSACARRRKLNRLLRCGQSRAWRAVIVVMTGVRAKSACAISRRACRRRWAGTVCVTSNLLALACSGRVPAVNHEILNEMSAPALRKLEARVGIGRFVDTIAAQKWRTFIGNQEESGTTHRYHN